MVLGLLSFILKEIIIISLVKRYIYIKLQCRKIPYKLLRYRFYLVLRQFFQSFGKPIKSKEKLPL